MCKRIKVCKLGPTSAKQNFSLYLIAFLGKNDVECAKTCYFELKRPFMHIIGFNVMKALGNVQTL